MAIEDQTLGAWLDALASVDPAPGGGAAAAMCATLAAALVSMVARFTIGRKRYADVDDHARELLTSSEQTRTMLLQLVEADAEAYQMVALAYKLPKGTEEEEERRHNALQRALTQATEVPVMIAEVARQVVQMANLIAKIGNRTVLTDAGAASFMAMAAISAAGLNVQVNLRELHDEVRGHALQKRLTAAMDGVGDMTNETLQFISARMNEK
jgi:methenyltetrahydrofolate cyclohydrolase